MIDLRRHFHGLRNNKDAEANLVSKCVANGVNIGRGSGFYTEEIGWFRLTFTMDKETLKEGLKRFISVLDQFNSV